ncbi:hypothetical protein DSO57_1036557 [Entomophthora muscae]|uniref:Uncharacterized protein n=1 Tax=Entomophthora muscae TaxID=34485 RepID=A0ACC2UK16_9FUNG|nr:hypothetical protein DSO57_1036557 [Entomophthora muscae]
MHICGTQLPGTRQSVKYQGVKFKGVKLTTVAACGQPVHKGVPEGPRTDPEPNLRGVMPIHRPPKMSLTANHLLHLKPGTVASIQDRSRSQGLPQKSHTQRSPGTLRLLTPPLCTQLSPGPALLTQELLLPAPASLTPPTSHWQPLLSHLRL